MKMRLSTALCRALLLCMALAGPVRPAVADVSELQAVRVATEQGTTRVFFDLSEAVPHRFFTLG